MHTHKRTREFQSKTKGQADGNRMVVVSVTTALRGLKQEHQQFLAGLGYKVKLSQNVNRWGGVKLCSKSLVLHKQGRVPHANKSKQQSKIN